MDFTKFQFDKLLKNKMTKFVKQIFNQLKCKCKMQDCDFWAIVTGSYNPFLTNKDIFPLIVHALNK